MAGEPSAAGVASLRSAPSLSLPVVHLPPTFFALGQQRYDVTTRALVMGILNRTPDSFFDQGSYWDFDAFLAQAEGLVAAGADLLDVGGVKAGPGPEVTAEEELERVIPAIEALRARLDVPLSVDTWRASVAREAYRAGAVVGNDISGFADPDYLAVAAEAGASVVATHIRLQPRVADPNPEYDDVVEAVCSFLVERAHAAEAAGIPAERISVDAGLDLGKTEPQSHTLVLASDRLAQLGYPLLLSASNKRFLGHLVGAEVDDRWDATVAAHTVGIRLGSRILRTHDVRAGRRTADVVAALLEAAHGRSPQERGP
jgi:dihydropteroate synthase